MPKNPNLITLSRHIISSQKNVPGASGDFTLLMASISLGIKFVSNNVRRAGISHLNGAYGKQNVQGESQQKLDVLADEAFMNSLRSSGKVCMCVTEEREEAIIVEQELRGPYAVTFDPLDGSSNIDCGVSVGTIFGIYKLETYSNPSVSDLLKPGTEMVAAGYAMYGSSTELVISTGLGVHGYTLDAHLGEFVLTRENISIPKRGKIYSINEGNSMYWDKATLGYISALKGLHSIGDAGKVAGTVPYSARYIGSMVADVHRTLLYGGVFIYPGDSRSKNGKLRVLYECFPMAFIIAKAGGIALRMMLNIEQDGAYKVMEIANMLDYTPLHIHDRSPICLGSPDDIAEYRSMIESHSSASQF